MFTSNTRQGDIQQPLVVALYQAKTQHFSKSDQESLCAGYSSSSFVIAAITDNHAISLNVQFR